MPEPERTSGPRRSSAGAIAPRGSGLDRQGSAARAKPRQPSPAERERRLLGHLRAHLGCPEIRFEERPEPVLGGTEARILAFRLAGAPPPFDGPLILRQFRRGKAADRSAVEAGIHDAARAVGIKTPACLLHETRRDLLGGAFVVLERVEGHALLGGLAIEAIGSGLRPRSVWRAIRAAPELWDRIPFLLTEASLAVTSVDAETVEAAIRARGGPPEFLDVDRRLARIGVRIGKVRLEGVLAPALAWLAAHRPPPPERRCLVHGDLGPTNLLVRHGQITSVIDWSKALLAEPEAEVGFLRASVRTAAISGLGSWNAALRWPLARVAEQVTDRHAALRPLDPDRLRWYETMRLIGLLASAAKRARPHAPRPHLLDGRGTTRAIVREIGRLTGVQLALPA